jgi:hypothetical protein
MMLQEALTMVTVGAVVGVPLALMAGHACRSFLYGVGTADCHDACGRVCRVALAVVAAMVRRVAPAR